MCVNRLVCVPGFTTGKGLLFSNLSSNIPMTVAIFSKTLIYSCELSKMKYRMVLVLFSIFSFFYLTRPIYIVKINYLIFKIKPLFKIF